MHKQAGNSTKTNASNYLKQITEFLFLKKIQVFQAACFTFNPLGTVCPLKPPELPTQQLKVHPVSAS